MGTLGGGGDKHRVGDFCSRWILSFLHPLNNVKFRYFSGRLLLLHPLYSAIRLNSASAWDKGGVRDLWRKLKLSAQGLVKFARIREDMPHGFVVECIECSIVVCHRKILSRFIYILTTSHVFLFSR